MTPDRWRQIEALYQTAQNCGTAERVALLENADPEIRSLVQRMLRESSGSQLLNWPLADLLGNADKTTIAPGAQLGPYRIQAQIGAGGMGTVFRAIDTRLDRIVAIKIAAERYSERFQIEARVISTLNHPHICTLHDVGPDYLVMEFIEGTTLTEEIAKGPMAQDRVARFGSQMASALAEAHAHDIIHRDLKPGNVMVTRHGVKVLDFGLAKIFSHSGITETNAIMGTPAYMPPEQMQGRECDARTDIYALGLVLAEMATGKRTTPGGRPQLDSLPEKLGHVVERCVGENPDDRWQNAREVKAELEWAAKAAPAAAVEVRGSRWRRALLWALAGAATTGLAPFAWFHTSDRKTVRAVPMRLQILTPANPRLQLTGLFALSPDGQRLALVASGANGVPSIWIRDLNSLEIRPLPGTEGVSTLLFWSPDSQFVAFDSGGKLLKIDVSGGAAQTVCGLDADGLGGSWNKDDVIVFGVFGKPIMRVSAAGGAATPLTVLDPSHGDVAHTVPWFLPDGKHFLYLRDNGINGAISVGSLDSKPEEQDSRRLFETASGAAYVPSSDPYSGMLVFLRGQTLMAQSFDARRLSLSGEPVRVTEDPIGVFLDYSLFSVSANGTLAYSSAGNDNQLTWFDAQGRILNTVGEPGPYVGVSVSPDGTRAFAYKRTIVPDRHIALWLLDLSRGTSTRSDLDPSTDNMDAVWASDGRSIIFGSDRVGQMKDIRRGFAEVQRVARWTLPAV